MGYGNGISWYITWDIMGQHKGTFIAVEYLSNFANRNNTHWFLNVANWNITILNS